MTDDYYRASKRIKVGAGYETRIVMETDSGFISLNDESSSSGDVSPMISLALEECKPAIPGKDISKLAVLDHIRIPELCYPASQFDGWESPYPVLPEEEVIDMFLVCELY
jgi:hypothetical protein